MSRDRLNTLKSKLPFNLGEEQENALLSIFKFINSKKAGSITISGSAGTGKTTIAKIIIDYIRKYTKKPFLLSAPTNKSKSILSSYTGMDVITLHKLFSLKPYLDILELDYNDLKFFSDDNLMLPKNGILIIDECSMVGKYMYEFIINNSKKFNYKVIFLGDDRQLAPVKEGELSKTFDPENTIYLRKIYRQLDDNPILKTLSELRYKPKYKFKEIFSNKGSMYIYRNWHDVISLIGRRFIDEDIKLLAYTNKRIEAFNRVIREEIFKNPKEYEIGEIIVGYDNYHQDKNTDGIINSEEYEVLSVCIKKIRIFNMEFNGYNLTLRPKGGDTDFDINVLSKDNDENNLFELSKYLDTLRARASIESNNKLKSMMWKEYFSVMESFATSFNLIYNSRVVKKKTIDYGYCITVHKSQSSTYDNIVVDMGNIKICSDKEELRQLQYVALSRTRNNIYMLL